MIPCPYCLQDPQVKGKSPRRCAHCAKPIIGCYNPTTAKLESIFPADLDNYRILGYAGQGGMGRVFVGQNKTNGEKVAIKFPSDSSSWDKEIQKRFWHEIETLQTLSHPNIVPILDRGILADRPYFVMKWVEGEDLARVLARCRNEKASLPFDLVYPLFQQLCQALQAIHDQGIVHRDVKPANLILTPDKQLRIIDFGIAKQFNTDTTGATQLTAVIGTIEYLAPEQLRGTEKIDHRADTFAAGLVMFELLTGHLPKGYVRWPSEVNPSVPAWFDSILQEMLEQDRDRRPANIGCLASRMVPSEYSKTIDSPPGLIDKAKPEFPGLATDEGKNEDQTDWGNKGKPLEISAMGPASKDQLQLWNPDAAACWSFLFSPAFGAYLHAANWRVLGKPDLVSKNMRWVWGTLLFILTTDVCLLFFINIKEITAIQGLSSMVMTVLLIAWYFSQARPQAQFVKERFQTGYARKGWIMPLLAGINAMGAHYFLFVFVSLLIPNQNQTEVQTKLIMDNLEAEVKRLIIQEWQKKPDLRGATIRDLTLIHKEGNTYTGIINVILDSKPERLLLEVTYDGRSIMWQIKPSDQGQVTDPAEVIESSTLPGLKLIRIKPGKFIMGSTPQEQEALAKKYFEGNRPAWMDGEWAHEVTLTKPYYMGKYEVTEGQFRKFVRATKYQTDAEKDGKGGFGYDASRGIFIISAGYTWTNTGFDEQSDDHPVVNVSWNDAVAFCEWLSKEDGREYRLPTEAEWEYACRGGSKGRFHFGDEEGDLGKYANIADRSLRARWDYSSISDEGFKKAVTSWFDVVSWHDGYPFTAPVGKFKPNGFGLYDMHGNASEWCKDWYEGYSGKAATDPVGPSEGSYRVSRGGGWNSIPRDCRAAVRFGDDPTYRNFVLGFRLAVSVRP